MRTLLKAAWGLALAILLVAVSIGIGSMRHKTSQASSGLFSTLRGQHVDNQHTWVFVLLTLIVPLAVAYLHHKASHTRPEDEKAAEMQKTQNERQNALREVRERQEELIRMAQEERRQFEVAQGKARENIRALQQGAHNREMAIRNMIEMERRQVVAYERGKIAAMAQDRFYYLLAARGHNALHLFSGPVLCLLFFRPVFLQPLQPLLKAPGPFLRLHVP